MVNTTLASGQLSGAETHFFGMQNFVGQFFAAGLGHSKSCDSLH
jgi:hypothetical protein